MHPLIIGKWDGLRAWLQWEPGTRPSLVYQVTADGPPDTVPDAPWHHLPLTDDDVRRGWKVVYVGHHGAYVRACFEVSADAPKVMAREAVFLKCWADVRLTHTFTRDESVTLAEGTILAATLEGRTVVYTLPHSVTLHPRTPQIVSMFSASPDPFHQIPEGLEYGIRDVVTGLTLNVSHTSATRNEIDFSGRQYTQLAHRNPDVKPAPAIAVVTGHVRDEMKPLKPAPIPGETPTH